MDLAIKQGKTLPYLEQGQGPVLLLLHGLLGALSNWGSVIRHFSHNHRVIVPLLPIYSIAIRKANLAGLLKEIVAFTEEHHLDQCTLMGNSLGGHLALLYALEHPEKIQKIVLTGSSGLYENNLQGSYIRRRDRAYVSERVRYTFFDPEQAPAAFVDEIYKIINDNMKALRIAAIAKSAQRNNLAEYLPKITAPTLLVWGLNDTITPPVVAHEFASLLPHATLRFIDRCCHAPMMEHPVFFNALVSDFLHSPSVLDPIPTSSLSNVPHITER